MRCRTIAALLAAALVLGACTGPEQEPLSQDTAGSNPAVDSAEPARYPVVSVADGDTITVSIDGVNERIRLIGIDAPELRPAECFGRQSADRAAELASGIDVGLIADDTQDDRDRYGRMLRYVVLPDGTILNGALVRDGYAREYTYDAAYRFQQEFRGYQDEAMSAAIGVWSAACREKPAAAAATTSSVPAPPPDPACPIKGNVNTKGDRIYHVPGDDSYPETVITSAKGERWFCSTAEAEAAGWRAARN